MRILFFIQVYYRNIAISKYNKWELPKQTRLAKHTTKLLS